MTEGLKALKELRQYESIPRFLTDMDIIEKELMDGEEAKQMIRNFNKMMGEPAIIEPNIDNKIKALEVILKKYDFKVAKNNNAYWLQYWVKDDCMGQMPISKEEYDLLKEVFK